MVTLSRGMHMPSTPNIDNRHRWGPGDKPGHNEPARYPPARLDKGRERTWARVPSTPGWASLGMRNPSPPPEHPDIHTSRYGDDPRQDQIDEDIAHLRHYERRFTNRPGLGPKGYVRSDDRIRDDIADALTDHHGIDATDIEFDVKDGTATLSGYVPDRRMRFLAEDVVSSLRGVRDVNNNIRVQPWRERAVGHR